ncbi:hypothetical protein AWW72_14200 [Acinetobacter sp. NRRL B-65365]|uniref:hypothetical protein n=1 Tax=Acinetobacter sp. NRRL B-65365 TaxID=1785092 RepID=UPI00079FEB3F|nr:hypothetical protein [Acinetobacter sp. NRRL B-65365]KYQ83491.1 hypothetical protein AWW72_14200 [Acinetobacter sp. NRRL B-65365]
MSHLVLDFLKDKSPLNVKKLSLNPSLTSMSQIVFLDRQVIKYFTQHEKYNSAEVVNFRENVLSKYDKSCNIISIMTAFYEGGSGNFETEGQKRRTAILDLKGIDDYFKYASVDEKLYFKSMKSATHAFTLDSGILEKNRKFTAIINKTYELYLELKDLKFNGMDIINRTKVLKTEMDKQDVSIGDPIAQYCFSLLTDYLNARSIFKVSGLENQTAEVISKRLYNSYADLRIVLFLHNFKARVSNKKRNFDVCFVTFDGALQIFYDQMFSNVEIQYSSVDSIGRMTNLCKSSINFEIFNENSFKKEEFEIFKNLFWQWSDVN